MENAAVGAGAIVQPTMLLRSQLICNRTSKKGGVFGPPAAWASKTTTIRMNPNQKVFKPDKFSSKTIRMTCLQEFAISREQLERKILDQMEKEPDTTWDEMARRMVAAAANEDEASSPSTARPSMSLKLKLKHNSKMTWTDWWHFTCLAKCKMAGLGVPLDFPLPSWCPCTAKS